ncbi:hypothetical protein BST81_06505 [Leptolyngbya sp. 'hensonii']|uniref:hypothetical protein n=1 Tax=Leptolyngbya sp. 'hensonii' TaxID=1922337 RepID=UPI00094F71B5|nr:hypothetical protein [Leptolyngbya sp. 'hensonii']OLP19391.1 hypothetical protein BST81_06505 [Leptolyngbya sp. 'hensonii']
MQITIDLPEALQQTLIHQAAQNQTTPEQIILATLTQKFLPQSVPDLANDPLFQLAGSITSNIPDLAENHDYYIGQALYEEMNRNAD